MSAWIPNSPAFSFRIPRAMPTSWRFRLQPSSRSRSHWIEQGRVDFYLTGTSVAGATRFSPTSPRLDVPRRKRTDRRPTTTMRPSGAAYMSSKDRGSAERSCASPFLPIFRNLSWPRKRHGTAVGPRLLLLWNVMYIKMLRFSGRGPVRSILLPVSSTRLSKA